jgi:hypothetical protein
MNKISSDIFKIFIYCFFSLSILIPPLIFFQYSLKIKFYDIYSFYFGIYFSLLIHELGHYILAIFFKMELININWNFKGVTISYKASRKYYQNIITTLAGIGFNFCILLSLYYFNNINNWLFFWNLFIILVTIYPTSNDSKALYSNLKNLINKI